MIDAPIGERKWVTSGPYPLMRVMVATFRYLQKTDRDVTICITGRKGVGKSTLMIQLAKNYIRRYFQKPFDIKKYIAFSNENIVAMMKNAPEYSPVCCDESINFAFSQNWMQSQSKALKVNFTKIRTRHLLFMFCIPNFWTLDKFYRDNEVTFWIHVTNRGRAIVFQPDVSLGSESTWHRDQFKKMFGKRGSFLFDKSSNLESKLRKHQCFYEAFSFPVMEKRAYDRYINLRNENIFLGEDNAEFGRDGFYKMGIKLPMWNAYRRQEEFKELINGNGKSISQNKLVDFLYTDPSTKQSTVPLQTSKNWIKDIDNILKNKP